MRLSIQAMLSFQSRYNSNTVLVCTGSESSLKRWWPTLNRVPECTLVDTDRGPKLPCWRAAVYTLCKTDEVSSDAVCKAPCALGRQKVLRFFSSLSFSSTSMEHTVVLQTGLISSATKKMILHDVSQFIKLKRVVQVDFSLSLVLRNFRNVIRMKSWSWK